MANMVPIRLMLLDDHSLVLRGMEMLLNDAPGIQLLGSFNTSQQLMAALAREPVDLVVTDYSLSPGEIDGLNLIRAIRARFPATQVLVLSSLHSPSTVSMALRCGAGGFLGKELKSGELLLAIRKVAAGKVYLHPDMAQMLADNEVAPGQKTAIESDESASGLIGVAQVSGLTMREHEVLRCYLDGMSVTQIAEKFSRSKQTISTQKQAAYKKLGLRSDSELHKVRHLLEGP